MSTALEMIRLTDARGNPTGEYHDVEPEPGSVVLLHGEHGTAWQRQFSDGLWHRVGGGRPRQWESLLANRNVVLVYGAAVRQEFR